jgi:hypothetical protein
VLETSEPAQPDAAQFSASIPIVVNAGQVLCIVVSLTIWLAPLTVAVQTKRLP